MHKELLAAIQGIEDPGLKNAIVNLWMLCTNKSSYALVVEVLLELAASPQILSETRETLGQVGRALDGIQDSKFAREAVG